MLVDSHCHLDFAEFSHDIDDVVSRANDVGVKTMLTICTRLSKFYDVYAVAEKYPNIYCTVGVHPHEAENESQLTVQKLLEFSNKPKVVGFGETGLDFFYNKSAHNIQEQKFRMHIEAARAAQLPVIVHTRNADKDTIRILQDEIAKGVFPGVVHCFSGDRELAKEMIQLGFYISVSGIITFKNAATLRDIILEEVPIERLLLETDSPYLAPVPKRGGRNEPAYSAYTARFLADLLSISEQKVADITTKNFFQLFSKTSSSQ